MAERNIVAKVEALRAKPPAWPEVRAILEKLRDYAEWAAVRPDVMIDRKSQENPRR
jgi:hypothetical protein